MQYLPLLLILAELSSPVAALEILDKSKQGSNTSTGLTPEHTHLRRKIHDHPAQHTVHHSHVRMVNNKGYHKKEAADSAETIAEDYALSIDFCTRWRLSPSTRAICSDYMRRRCRKQPTHHREAGLCAAYLSGASMTKAEAGWDFSKGKETEGIPLPEQGYSGPMVQHDDMETRTKDWRKEYGPKSKHPHRTFTNVCAEYPNSAWCVQNGYVPEYDEAREQEQQEEKEEEEERQQRQQEEEQEEGQEERQEEAEEDKEETWWQKTKRKHITPIGEDVKKHHEKMRRHIKHGVKNTAESLQDAHGKIKDLQGSAVGQQALLTSILVLGACLATL